MTYTPAPPPPGYGQPYQPAPQRTNGFAVASLVCSLLGFCIAFIGGLLGIIFGVLGLQSAKKTGSGRGLALSGLIIGIVSLAGWGLIFGAGGVAFFTAYKISEAPRATAKQFMTDLTAGNIDAALAQTSSITRTELETQNKSFQSLGTFKDMTSSGINIVNNQCTLVGVAQFSNGIKAYTLMLVQSGGTWKVTSATFQ